MPKHVKKYPKVSPYFEKARAVARVVGGAAAAATQIQKVWRGFKSRQSTKFRGTGGSTRTKTRTKDVKEMTGHVGGTVSFFSHNRKAAKIAKTLMDNMQRPQYYIQNVTSRTIAAIKQQAVAPIVSLGTNADITIMQGQIANAIKAVTGSTAAAPVQSKNQFMFLDTIHGMTLISSSSLATVECTIYDVICRQDTNDAPQLSWSSGLADEYIGSQTLFTTTPGAYPSQAIRFGKYWRIVKRTHVNFAPGAVHKHVFNHKVNHKIPFDLLDNAQAYLKGISMYSFAVFHGYPVHNNGTTVTGLADSAIDYFTEYTYKYRYSTNSNSFTTSTDNQGAITVAAETGINEFVSAVLTGDPVG